MGTVHTTNTNQQLSSPNSINFKAAKIACMLILSGVSLALTCSPTLAQLTPLDSPNNATTQLDDNPLPVFSTNSISSAVSVETYSLGPGDQIRIDVLADFEAFAYEYLEKNSGNLSQDQYQETYFPNKMQTV